MNRYIKALAMLVMAGALAACGGGGGSAGATGGGVDVGGTPPGGTPDPAAQQTAKVADFALFTDKTTITNAGSDSALVTVQAVDANRNVVPGATVTVSTDQGSVFTPSTSSGTTDAQGRFTGRLSIGEDKTDREVTVSVTINGLTKRSVVRVSGSKLVLSALPSSPQPGASVTLTANLKDASGNPIVGVPVTFGGTIPELQGASATTNSSGDATRTFVAPAAAGAYSITASGSGTQASDLNLTVFASSSAVPAAAIPAGVTPSLSASPNVLAVNAPGTSTNRAALRFLILDSANNPIQNVRVEFMDMTTGLPAQGAQIATTSTMYTDASGSVSTQYIPGPNSSPTNGVRIRACYSGSDLTQTDRDNCRNATGRFVDVTLTVAGQALALSIGDDNKLEAVSGTYIKRFAVTVADSAGRAVANAPVDISVDLSHYAKGDYVAGFVGSTGDNGLSVVPLRLTGAYPSMTLDAQANGQRVWCPNEDANRNTIVDPTNVFAPEGADPARGENYNNSFDTNGQPTLEPRKSDLIINYDNPSVTSTDANGLLIIKVQYSQRFGTWLAYRVRVTANVAGSQGMAERLFVTDILEADKDNGSFRTPPYGVHSCVTPN